MITLIGNLAMEYNTDYVHWAKLPGAAGAAKHWIEFLMLTHEVLPEKASILLLVQS